MKEIRKELLDELLEDYATPEDLLGDEGLLKALQKALMERAFGAELTEHLGYEKRDPIGFQARQSNRPRGSSTGGARLSGNALDSLVSALCFR